MNEEEVKAINFSEEVDAILAGYGRPLPDGENNGDGELVALAGRLQAVNASASSKVPVHLRHKLLLQLESKQTKQRRAYSFGFEGSGFGGCCAEGMRNEVISLDQAIKESGYTMQLPGVVPDGYALTDVRLLGISPYAVFVIYEGPGDRLGLYQSSGGTIGQIDESTVVVDARESVVLAQGSMEKVAIGELTAALLEGYELVWEENGVTYHLIGPGVAVETLKQIAESLGPAG
jgi:hypothetical protein